MDGTNYVDMIKKRKEALEKRDAQTYAILCDFLGIEAEDNLLYEQGQVSSGVLKSKNNLENSVKEATSEILVPKREREPGVDYELPKTVKELKKGIIAYCERTGKSLPHKFLGMKIKQLRKIYINTHK